MEWCAVLWCACRHHVYEIHVQHVAEKIIGKINTSSESLFKRYQSESPDLNQEITERIFFYYYIFFAEFCFPFQVLVLFNSCENDFSQRLADEIIEWGTELLENDTFARLDYLELLELTIFFLGGSVYPFSPSKASWFNFLIINFA